MKPASSSYLNLHKETVAAAGDSVNGIVRFEDTWYPVLGPICRIGRHMMMEPWWETQP